MKELKIINGFAEVCFKCLVIDGKQVQKCRHIKKNPNCRKIKVKQK